MVSSLENVGLGSFKKHTRGIGSKFLLKMGYEGKGLGIHGQEITKPIEVEERPRYQGLGYHEETSHESHWVTCSYCQGHDEAHC